MTQISKLISMTENKKLAIEAIASLLVLGFFFYVLTSGLKAVYVPVVIMDANWCEEYVDLGEYGGMRCNVFKNDLEYEKYVYNEQITKRNQWVLIFCLVVGVFIYYVLHRKLGLLLTKSEKESADSSSRWFVVCFVMSGLAVIIVPLVLGEILPTPDNFLPQFVIDINEVKVEEALRQIDQKLN